MTDLEAPTITPPRGQIAAALAKFQGKMPTVAKDKTANIPGKEGRSGYSYKYADLADVTKAAAPILAECGLAFTSYPEERQGGYVLIGVLLHESGESITGTLPLRGNSMQDLGSALTYNRRFLLGALTGIATDDDTDAEVGNEAAPTGAGRAPSAGRQPTSRQSTAADPSWGDKIADCSTWEELNAAYAEAEKAGVLNHMIGDDTIKARLLLRRQELGIDNPGASA